MIGEGDASMPPSRHVECSGKVSPGRIIWKYSDNYGERQQGPAMLRPPAAAAQVGVGRLPAVAADDEREAGGQPARD